MKQAMFFAALMYSSAAVATSGMSGGFPDQSANPSSKARLAEVTPEFQRTSESKSYVERLLECCNNKMDLKVRLRTTGL